MSNHKPYDFKPGGRVRAAKMSMYVDAGTVVRIHPGGDVIVRWDGESNPRGPGAHTIEPATDSAPPSPPGTAALDSAVAEAAADPQ